MWLFTKYGFVSVAQHKDDVDYMILRFRTAVDADWFIALADRATTPDLKHMLHVTDDTDYCYWFATRRNTWVAMQTRIAADIDYHDFKSAADAWSRPGAVDVKTAQLETARRLAYFAIWGEMCKVQDADTDFHRRKGGDATT